MTHRMKVFCLALGVAVVAGACGNEEGRGDIVRDRFVDESRPPEMMPADLELGEGESSRVPDQQEGEGDEPESSEEGAGLAQSETEEASDPAEVYSEEEVLRCPGWRTAIRLDEAGGALVLNPKIAYDDAGNALVVWAQEDVPDNGVIWSSHYDAAEESWGKPTKIEPGDSGYVVRLELVMNGSGDALVAWTRGGRLWSNRYLANEGWQTATQHGTEALTTGFGPRLAIDEESNAFMAWDQENADGSHSGYAARFVDGEGWGEPHLLVRDERFYVGPNVAFNHAGEALVVWGSPRGVWASWHIPGTGWSDAVPLNKSSISGIEVAFDGDGAATVVGDAHDGAWASRYTPESGWGDAVVLGNPVMARQARVAATPGTDVVGTAAFAVWRENEEDDNCSTWARRYDTETGWGEAELLARGAYPTHPKVVVDDEGNAYFVWEQEDDSVLSLATARYVNGEGWSETDLLRHGDSPVLGQHVDLALHPEGEPVAVWPQWPGGGGLHLRFSRYCFEAP